MLVLRLFHASNELTLILDLTKKSPILLALASVNLNLLPATNPCDDEHVKVVIPLKKSEEVTETDGPGINDYMTLFDWWITSSLAIPILFTAGTLVIL